MIKEAIVRALRWIVKGTPNVRITANIVETAPQNRLAGKKVIVTGGGRGLGFYIARKCRQEGASVLIAGRDERVLQEASQRLCDCPYLVFDVRRTAGIAAFLSEADRLLGGRVDCLVNNTGISLHEKSFADVTEEGFDRQFDTNLKGPYFLTQTFIDYMNREKIGQGNILFITSERGLYCDDIPYGLTKAAINENMENKDHVGASRHYDAVDAASDFRTCRFQYRNRYQAYQQYQLLDNETAP